MKTYVDIYLMMCDVLHEYSELHECNKRVFVCYFCENNSYCGVNSIMIAKQMIFEY